MKQPTTVSSDTSPVLPVLSRRGRLPGIVGEGSAGCSGRGSGCPSWRRLLRLAYDARPWGSRRGSGRPSSGSRRRMDSTCRNVGSTSSRRPCGSVSSRRAPAIRCCSSTGSRRPGSGWRRSPAVCPDTGSCSSISPATASRRPTSGRALRSGSRRSTSSPGCSTAWASTRSRWWATRWAGCSRCGSRSTGRRGSLGSCSSANLRVRSPARASI